VSRRDTFALGAGLENRSERRRGWWVRARLQQQTMRDRVPHRALAISCSHI